LSVSLMIEICVSISLSSEYVGCINAGTVEFLVSEGEFYFIVVNPRGQVEHTITEMISGVDIVQTQFKVAEGSKLHDTEVGIPNQNKITTIGYAIQSRVTTEDKLNDFMQDTGRI